MAEKLNRNQDISAAKKRSTTAAERRGRGNYVVLAAS